MSVCCLELTISEICLIFSTPVRKPPHPILHAQDAKSLEQFLAPAGVAAGIRRRSASCGLPDSPTIGRVY